MRVEFPDVELWATGFLRSSLSARTEAFASGVYVSNVIPSPRRDRMVIVRRDGGPRLSPVLEAARLGVQVWAKTEQDANDLATLVRALLGDGVNDRGNTYPGVFPGNTYPGALIQVKKVNDTGPSMVSDPSNQPLRYFTAELTVRGQALT